MYTISGRKWGKNREREAGRQFWSLNQHTQHRPLFHLVSVSVLPLQLDTLHSRRTGAVSGFFEPRIVHPIDV